MNLNTKYFLRYFSVFMPKFVQYYAVKVANKKVGEREIYLNVRMHAAMRLPKVPLKVGKKSWNSPYDITRSHANARVSRCKNGRTY
jgi:hypothetical protein